MSTVNEEISTVEVSLPPPAAIIIMHRGPRAKFLGEQPPGAAGAQQVKNPVENLAQIPLARTAAFGGGGQQRLQ